ncbi:uncharacterized protein LOC112030114 isoform X3 [Quercus suber]|uniref:uncharacterized protein LOC112030114 isoform X3 n=1 Tax=Quercus suber TaxID=58331 RepID=UPI000CE1AEC7|nr:uncharacterized protein LOC112030114 isoform X2 [Quercus suber]
MLKNRLVADFTLDPKRIKDKKCMEISLSTTYDNVRSNYFKEYLKFSKEEVRSNVPLDLTQDKWDALCDLYETTTWKKKQGGKEIGKVDFYKMTRTKKESNERKSS